jgi:hypothetical protein
MLRDAKSTAIIIGLLTVGLGLSIAIGLCVRMGLADGLRWTQNWPSATTFMVSSYAMAAGIFAYVVRTAPSVIPAGAFRWTLFAFAGIVALVVISNAWTDFTLEDPNPTILNRLGGRGDDVIRLERQLRALPPSGRQDSALAREYRRLVKPFANLRGVRSRANWLAYVLLLENIQAGLLAGAFLVYAIAFALFVPQAERGAAPQQLVAVLMLFLTWYPFRLYAQWYQYSIYREEFSSQRLFWFLLAVAIGAMVLLFFVAKPGTTLTVSGGLFVLVGSVLGAAKLFNWEWTQRVVRRCADGLADCPFGYYAMLYLLVVGLCAVVAGSAFVDTNATDEHVSVQPSNLHSQPQDGQK